jgi:hypothetical protein
LQVCALHRITCCVALSWKGHYILNLSTGAVAVFTEDQFSAQRHIG